MTDLATLLADKSADAVQSSALTATEHGAVATVPTSDTVLTVDRWGKRRGNDLSAEWKELQALAGLEPEESDEESPEPSESRRLNIEPIDPLVAADAHASLFEPSPRFAERPKDASRAAWWRQLMETPEYRSLRSQTVLDSSLSGLASKNLCDQWIEYAVELAARTDSGDGCQPGSDSEPIADQVARIRSTSKALAEARETVNTAQDMAAGLGMGAAGSKLDHATLAEYFRRVRDDGTLRRILEFAGRAIRRCRALQRTKTTATRGELTGIELGGDVSRLVPWELSQVAGSVPELETLALYRLAQHRSLCYRQRKVDPKPSGPIVIVVDESGSMNGEKIVAAKGIALALAWLARQQKRWTALVGFSGGTKGTRLACPPNATNQAALIEWLEHFFSGGTTADVPFSELPFEYWPEFVSTGMQRGKTDIIVITDGEIQCDEEIADRFIKWKRDEQATAYGVVIENELTDVMERLCDRLWSISQIELDSDAVESVLSI